MKAVIMAGGQGTRLRPLTCLLPKPMVPLLNKPCMAYIIELLRKHHIKDIAVTTQYLPEAIAHYFGDGGDYGVNLVYFEEPAPLGTAGSIRNAASFLDEPFIVISGDALTDIDLTDAVRFHRERGAAATIVLSRSRQPVDFGVVLTEPDGKIFRFLEKPDWSEVFSDTVNTGIYILEPELLVHIPEGRECDFGKELFPALLASGAPLYGYVSDGYWSDIGSIEQYKQSQFDMLEGKVDVGLDGTCIAPGVYVASGARIHPTSRVEGPAFIGPGAELGEHAVIGPYTIVGASSRIGSRSVIDRSIVWHEADIGEGAEMNESLLCNHTVVKPGARCERHSVIGSRCVIGRKAAVRSSVKLWPNKRVQDEAHVAGSLVWGDAVRSRLFGKWGAEGIAGIEMSPDFAVRFAAAYGSQFAPGSRLLLTCSDHDFASIMKDALLPALRSVQIDCLDGGISLAEATRAFACGHELSGALHVQYTPLADSGVIRIECSDSQGLPIDKALERKVQQTMKHDDFRRPRADSPGRIGSVSGITPGYFKKFEAAAGWQGRIRTVAVAADPQVFEFAQALLQPGAEEIVYAGPAYDLTALARAGADLCVAFGEAGREWTVVTPDARLLGGDELLLVSLLAVLHARPGFTLGLPMQSPAIADAIAESLGGRIVRTRNSPRAVLEASADPLFHPLYNGIYAAAAVMRHIEYTGLRPDQMLALIPKHYRKSAVLDCPWEKKGETLRRIAEQLGGLAEMTEGFKIFDERGTIWICPDSDAPLLRVIAESGSGELATNLLGHYVADVERVLN